MNLYMHVLHCGFVLLVAHVLLYESVTSTPTYEPTYHPSFDASFEPAYDPTYDPTFAPAFIPTYYPRSANLTNYDFENDTTVTSYTYMTPTGWSSYGNTLVIISGIQTWLNYDSCPSGNYCAGVQNSNVGNVYGSYLNQSFTLSANQYATVTFYLTSRRGTDTTSTGCTVSYGSITLNTFYTTESWVLCSVTIPAISTSRDESLKFVNTATSGDCTFIIDLVKLYVSNVMVSDDSTYVPTSFITAYNSTYIAAYKSAHKSTIGILEGSNSV